MRNMTLTKISTMRMIPCTNHHRMYAVSPTKPLQKIFGFGKSEKEKEMDEAVKRAKETTDSLQEGAERIKNTVISTSQTLKNLSEAKENLKTGVWEKVSETGHAIADKIKEPVKGAVSHAWNKSAERVEEKVAEKIKDRVLGKEGQQGKNADKPN